MYLINGCASTIIKSCLHKMWQVFIWKFLPRTSAEALFEHDGAEYNFFTKPIFTLQALIFNLRSLFYHNFYFNSLFIAIKYCKCSLVLWFIEYLNWLLINTTIIYQAKLRLNMHSLIGGSRNHHIGRTFENFQCLFSCKRKNVGSWIFLLARFNLICYFTSPRKMDTNSKTLVE